MRNHWTLIRKFQPPIKKPTLAEPDTPTRIFLQESDSQIWQTREWKRNKISITLRNSICSYHINTFCRNIHHRQCNTYIWSMSNKHVLYARDFLQENNITTGKKKVQIFWTPPFPGREIIIHLLVSGKWQIVMYVFIQTLPCSWGNHFHFDPVFCNNLFVFFFSFHIRRIWSMYHLKQVNNNIIHTFRT